LYVRLAEILFAYTGSLTNHRDVPIEARQFYRSVMRVVLIMHHDFPEFFTENHVRLCSSIPSNCAQLRNLVVSAYPSSMSDLPDPFTQGFKVDRLDDIRRNPVIRADIVAPLDQANVRQIVDGLLQTTSQNGKQIGEVCHALSKSAERVTLSQALILYIATEAISVAGSKGPTFNKNTPHAQLLHSLTRTLPLDARYDLISAMVNQLRYPNSHTHYFSYALLDIFGFPSNDPLAIQIQEQIARILLERLIVFRPHPWGLLITVLELYKNPQYDFFKLPFVQASEEVWNLPALQSVRSGGGGYV
jgi:CCR4-NOT transcription complex subunit 1